MARPSEGSQSLVDLASSKNRTRREEKEELAANSSPRETALMGAEIRRQKNSRSRTEPYANVELIRRKYIHQNKALAKNNSMMMSRISDMETRISELINENMLLHKYKTFKDVEVKRILEEKLQSLEARLVAWFREIFQTLQEFRLQEGIHENPQLEAFKIFLDDDPPYTSTPLEEEEQNSDSVISDSPQSPGQSMYDITVSSSNEDIVVAQSIPEVQENTMRSSSHRTQSPERLVIDVDSLRHAMLKNEQSSSISVRIEGSPIYQTLQEPRDQGDILNTKNKNRDPWEIESAMRPQEKQAFQVFREEQTELNSPATMIENYDPKIPLEDQRQLDSTEVKIEEESAIGRRLSRNRKQVSYKWPSLSRKMRRKSSKFVDAVADDVGPTDNKNTSKKEALKRKNDDSMKSAKKPRRKPLANIDNATNASPKQNMQKEKLLIQNKDSGYGFKENELQNFEANAALHLNKNNLNLNAAMSIFDFEEDIKPIRTYKKERTSFGSRATDLTKARKGKNPSTN